MFFHHFVCSVHFPTVQKHTGFETIPHLYWKNDKGVKPANGFQPAFSGHSVDSMCLHSKKLALCGIRDMFDWDKNGQQKNASFQSFTPFSTTSMFFTVYYRKNTDYVVHSRSDLECVRRCGTTWCKLCPDKIACNNCRARTIICAYIPRNLPCAEYVICSTGIKMVNRKMPVFSRSLRFPPVCCLL